MTDLTKAAALSGWVSWLSAVYIIIAEKMDWPGLGVAAGVILLGLPVTVGGEIVGRVVASALARLREERRK